MGGDLQGLPANSETQHLHARRRFEGNTDCGRDAWSIELSGGPLTAALWDGPYRWKRARFDPPIRLRKCAPFMRAIPIRPRSATSDRHRELSRDPSHRQALSLLLWPVRRPTPDREILGRGLRHLSAVVGSMREPNAQVIGIDISKSSLSHTRDLQQKHSIRNLDLRRLAIESVGGSARLRRDSLHRRLASPARPGPWPAVIARSAGAGWSATRHGLCGVWPRGRLHDAGILPPAGGSRKRPGVADAWRYDRRAFPGSSDCGHSEPGEGLFRQPDALADAPFSTLSTGPIPFPGSYAWISITG